MMLSRPWVLLCVLALVGATSRSAVAQGGGGAAGAGAPDGFVARHAVFDDHVDVDRVVRVLDIAGGLVSPDGATLSSRVEIDLTITAWPGAVVGDIHPLLITGPGLLVTAGFAPVRETAESGVTTVTYTIATVPTDTGLLEIPSIGVVYDIGGDGPERLTLEDTVTVTVAELAPGVVASDDPADAPGAAEARPSRAWMWMVAGLLGLAVVLAALIGGGVLFVLRGRQRTEHALVARPPDIVALERLDELERAGLIERHEYERLVEGASDVARWYIGERFGLRAPEMTTQEFLSAARRNADLGGEAETLGGFLRSCDELKFAKARGTQEEAESSLGMVRSFVVRTRMADGHESPGTPHAERAGPEETPGSAR